VKRQWWCVYSTKTKTVFCIGSKRQMERDIKCFRRDRWVNIRVKEITL
jgi:hypothetical protein